MEFSMSDIKLFQINGNKVSAIEGKSVAVERSLQSFIEKHLDTFLGVRLLASEHTTGKTHGGRIDTLGLDENYSPVIIEYKRSLNENVINQGLYYLDWLLDHKGEFTLLVQKHIDPKLTEDDIDWHGARLLCIAGEFTKFDEHAVKQIDRNIELIRYRSYGKELLLFELVNATTGSSVDRMPSARSGKTTESTVTDKLAKASTEIKDRYESLKAFAEALGDDVQVKTLKHYIAFKRIKNFASVEIHPQDKTVIVFVKADFDQVRLEEGFTRDVRKIGHFGTGDLEITIRSDDDLERAKPLIVKSYEDN
jgi:predicted transport protein